MLTQQLLSFSSKQILEMKIVDLNSIVTSFHDIMRRTIRENIEIKLSLSNDIIGVSGDRNQIEQIIMNLVVNAQDAVRDKGLITIETAPVFLDEEYARQHAEVQPGKYLMLVVTDTGSGMGKETLTHMYEPFFTTKAVGEGTGLGLATIYGIVKQHEGHIWVYSEVGKGTVFKLYFPVVEDQPIDRLDIIPDTDVLDSRERTVLLVEDNEMVRNLVYDFLVERGFNVIMEEGPRQAIKATANQHIDLLVTDAVMPDMNGAELYKRLLGTHQKLKVLYMSGYAENIIAHHGILDEGINFIQKPFTAIDLSHKIHQALVDGG
jgi:CheY-like chemotaxis protein